MKNDEQAPLEQQPERGGMEEIRYEVEHEPDGTVTRYEVERNPDRWGDCWPVWKGGRILFVRPDPATEARWWAGLEAAWARNRSRQADQEAER